MRNFRSGLALLLLVIASSVAQAQGFRQRLPEDEVIYFLLPDRFENGDRANDRGGLAGDRLATGYDPTHKGFFLGGDLKGLITRLDYIEGLGATAIWLGPIYQNKAVQGLPGQETAGYHGYWITDFTRVDAHYGEDADMRAFVRAAHARGMKVYLDIIANHTADVIRYRECPRNDCAYRSRADYPYGAKGGVAGPPINPGFLGDRVRTAANFARLTDPAYAYTPYVPAGEATLKMPAWLNDPRYYHNRGDSTFRDESSTMGDFSGLDDLMTEHPRVVAGMIDIFGGWIDRYGIDGFRIDTARHVNPEFWQAFVPAMLDRARAKGIANFHIFGEVATDELDPALLARFTRVDRFPAVLDFAFRRAVLDALAVPPTQGEGPSRGGTDGFERLFNADALYEGGAGTARQLPTFVSNHDAGRFAHFVRKALPNAGDAEVLARVKLAHAMLLTLRGVPTIYSGDEQGFAGDGGDQDSREPLFAAQVASYLDNKLVGTAATHARDRFDTRHPLYRSIASLARLRTAHTALRRGRQQLRFASDTPGLFAVSRFDPADGREYLLAFNTSAAPITTNVEVETGSARFTALAGACPARAERPGSVAITLPAFGHAVCRAR